MRMMLLAVLTASTIAAAQEEGFRFTGIAAGTEPSYAMAANGALPLPFTTPRGAPLEIHVPAFVGEAGDLVVAEPSIADAPQARADQGRIVFTPDRAVHTLVLKVPPIPGSGKYTGTLVVAQAGKAPILQRLQLSRAGALRPARLAIEPKQVSVYKVGAFDRPGFTLTLRNPSDWAAEGVFLRLADATASAGTHLDVSRALRWRWNDDGRTDLWRSSDDRARSVPPNGQADITARAVDLSPGEYTLKLGLGAANATVDPEQQATVKLYVKHGWVRAVLALLFAIAVSYLATKGLTAQRHREALLRKAAAIRPEWLHEEAPLLPVMSVRAMLRQVESRNARWFDALFGQDTNAEVLGRAERIVKMMGRARELRRRIALLNWDNMLVNRANKRLRELFDGIDASAIDDALAARVDAELAHLEKWLVDASQRRDLYGAALAGELDAIRAQVVPRDFKSGAAIVEALLAGIGEDKVKAATSERDLIAIENRYAKLKVLQERRKYGDEAALGKLLQMLRDDLDAPIEEFFRLADDLAWQRLRAAKIEFTRPDTNMAEPLPEYQLIHFEVAPNDEASRGYYLFKHNLQFLWSLTLRRPNGERVPLTQPVTREPRLVQFVPEPGVLYVSVTPVRGGEKLERIDREPLEIAKSADFGFRSAFRANEVTALVIATLFALLSGLATFYAGKHAFGSLADYIALLVWGAGVDQTKNFSQNLAATPGKS